MAGRTAILGLSVAALLAATSLPASAQLDDFLCSTFSYKCSQPPPPPAPALAPAVEPPASSVKHARRVHKAKSKHSPAPKEQSASAPSAPDKPK